MKQKSLNTILKFIGTELTELRKKKGFTTIKEFASKHKLPEIQYWRMEKGKANVTIKSLSRVLSIHKITMEHFFCSLNEIS
jgi:transcriptional regulator with XRE-family HTH domain